MRHILYSIMLAGLFGVLATGCREELEHEQYYISADQQYDSLFREMYGTIDSDHTWNTVMRRTVHLYVTLPEGRAAVKIYTSDPRGNRKDCFILAQGYVNETTVTAVEFDCPGALDYVYVAVIREDGAREVHPVQLRENPLPESFLLRSSEFGPSQDVTLIVPSDKYYYPFRRSYYEWEKRHYTYFRNRYLKMNGVCGNFEFKSAGDDILVIPFGNDAQHGRELRFVTYKSEEMSLDEVKTGIENGTLCGTPVFHTDTATVIFDTNAEDDEAYARTKPFIIQGVQAGHRVLFYTYTPATQRYDYTVAALNADGNIRAGVMDMSGCSMVRFDAAGRTPTASGHLTTGVSDLAFAVRGAYVIDYDSHQEKPEFSCTVVLEAIQDTTDMDYNDVVLRMYHVTGRDSMRIELVAAGDTLPIRVQYEGKDLFGEVHEALGVEVQQAVGTGYCSPVRKPSRTYRVDPLFSLTEGPRALRFIVERSEGYACLQLPEWTDVSRVFVIANPLWAWTQEGHSIDEAYPLIRRWVRDMNHHNWCSGAWLNLNEEVPQTSPYWQTE